MLCNMAKWKEYRRKIRPSKFTSYLKQIQQNIQKSRYELVNKPIKQPNRKFLHINLVLKIIMDCRTDKSCSF